MGFDFVGAAVYQRGSKAGPPGSVKLPKRPLTAFAVTPAERGCDIVAFPLPAFHPWRPS